MRDFLLSTQANLDNQQELDEFLSYINPTLRDKVSGVIFSRAINVNDVFKGYPDCVEQFIMHIETTLVLPDDTVFQQGASGQKLYFIADGECQVGVNDHHNRQVMVREIKDGDFFGELSLIFGIPRTATVVSSNYCTMATITSDVLLVLF